VFSAKSNRTKILKCVPRAPKTESVSRTSPLPFSSLPFSSEGAAHTEEHTAGVRSRVKLSRGMMRAGPSALDEALLLGAPRFVL
jgi:hypothetical protein